LGVKKSNAQLSTFFVDIVDVVDIVDTQRIKIAIGIGIGIDWNAQVRTGRDERLLVRAAFHAAVL